MTRRQPQPFGFARFGLPVLFVLASMNAFAFADTVKVQGLIKGRSGAMLIVETNNEPKLIIMLEDNTEVGEVQGLLKLRRKEISMAELIPGLAIQAEGNYNEARQLVAKSIKFKGDDLKRAHAIQAGLTENKAQTQKNKAELEKHNAELQAQNEALKNQQGQLTEQQKKTAANQAAVAAAMARFGQLDDYYILDEVTLLFANGKSNIESKYEPELLQLATKAKTIDGYMIEIKGFASSTGSAAVNQKLSEDRAANVAHLLLQRGRVPLTNMLAPGAMGESEQVGDENSADREAQNRRVVVRVLQNKGIAALKETPPGD